MDSDTDILERRPASGHTIGEYLKRGPGSSVGIAIDYEPDCPVSNPGGDEIFRNRPDRPWGPPSLL